MFPLNSVTLYLITDKFKMKVFFIHAEHFKLDGGACFGVVPKSIWNKYYPCDENNMIVFTLRNLLVEEGNRLILFDTGVGNKQNDKFRGHFYIQDNNNLINSLNQAGFTPENITDVVHTHLHFDHCGGTFRISNDGNTEAVFPNARLWCSKAQWNWANKPNAREKASYLLENIQPMQDSGKLEFIDGDTWFTPNIFLKTVNGHTEGQLIPHINFMGKTLVYMADFIPTAAHISIPYIAGFDTRPLISMDEKIEFLNLAAAENYLLLFQHDAINECCTLISTEKGVKVKETGVINNFI